jgi:hypothetical protein
MYLYDYGGFHSDKNVGVSYKFVENSAISVFLSGQELSTPCAFSTVDLNTAKERAEKVD